MAEHNTIGKLGEEVAKTFLMKHGFTILDTNYSLKYGEIDIIAQKDKKIRFVEVKTVKVRGLSEIHRLRVHPEENLTLKKWRHLKVSVESYLKHKNVPHVTLWQIDLACVYLDTENKEGRVVLMENIHKE
jgi:putative endonuclease